MTVSAGVAIMAFGLWFFFFSGSSPLPVGIGGVDYSAATSRRPAGCVSPASTTSR